MSDELSEARQRIESLQIELARARTALEDFTYSVSHDLRAPLRHVTSYLKIIREDLGDSLQPETAGHLQTASGAAALIGRQIDGLLLLSRLGRIELEWSQVDLARLVSEVREQLAPGVAGRRVEWRIACDLPVLPGDMALLGQMLGHLLGNACKFTAACESALIEVGWRRLNDSWGELVVADNGAGFDPRFQDRLFTVFQRLHSSKQFDGLGIGLAFSRLVVELHGGTIQAQGALSGGCRVTLRLPLIMPTSFMSASQ